MSKKLSLKQEGHTQAYRSLFVDCPAVRVIGHAQSIPNLNRTVDDQAPKVGLARKSCQDALVNAVFGHPVTVVRFAE